jgi:VanZ family protein
MTKGDKRLYYWLPVFVWLEVIFILSSIPGSYLPPLPSEMWLFWGHRIAHMVEYSVLGVLLIRAFTSKKIRAGAGTVLFLAIFIFAAGSFDEWHQTFVPGRHPALLDALFDTINGALGMLIYCLWFQQVLETEVR